MNSELESTRNELKKKHQIHEELSDNSNKLQLSLRDKEAVIADNRNLNEMLTKKNKDFDLLKRKNGELEMDINEMRVLKGQLKEYQNRVNDISNEKDIY